MLGLSGPEHVAGLLEPRDVAGLVVGHHDVDDELGRQAGYCGGADVLHPAERSSPAKLRSDVVLLRTAHLPPPPLRIVDVGGGADHQSLPLARRGYDVTIVDSSPAMLDMARETLAAEGESVAGRVQLVHAYGEDAPGALEQHRYGAVLCHGVVMYLYDPRPLVDALCALVAPGGIVSIVAKNVEVLACRPALAGNWAEALAAFDADRQVNALGMETRGDSVAGLSETLAVRRVEPVAWYGVRLFADGWARERPSGDPEDLCSL